MLAIYVTEAEACILEILAYSCPETKEDIFIYDREKIYNMAMPLWHEPDPQLPTPQPAITSQPSQDLPPHIMEWRPCKT